MIWPFSRQRRTVMVEVSQVADLVAAIDRLADAQIRAAKIRAGWETPPAPPPPPPRPEPNGYERDFCHWLNGKSYSAAQRSDYLGLFQVICGARAADAATVARARITLHAVDAPLPPGL